MDYIEYKEQGTFSKKLLTCIFGIGVLLTFYIGQIAAVIFEVIAESLRWQITGENGIDLYFPMMFLVEVVTILILIAIYFKQIRYYIVKELQTPFIFIGKCLAYYALMYILLIVFNMLDYLLYPDLFDVVGDNQDYIETALQSVGILMFLSITITGPIVEEFYFRYVVIDKILIFFPKYIAAIFASLFFAFIHIGFAQAFAAPDQVLHLMFGYLPVAIALGFIYVREKNMTYNIIIHMLNNLLAVVSIIMTM